jgi:outer membrane protein TolC
MITVTQKFLLSLALAVAAVCPVSALGADDPGLELAQAIALAQSGDPWIQGSRYTQDALEAEATSARTLPDPKMSLLLANLPTDTFSLSQEPMTQVGVGVSQLFPRGDSLELMSEQKSQLGLEQPYQRANRQAKVAMTVGELWLEAFKSQQTIALIEQDRALFEQLVDAAMASYSSAMGKTRQQDVIRAQLELTQLEDRLTMLHQQMDADRQRLSEWVGRVAIARPLARTLEELPLPHRDIVLDQASLTPQQVFELVQSHPALLALEQRIQASDTGVELARQKYKPEWGVSAQYGHREDDPQGMSRADFFSVGVTLDVPLFTSNRQDQDVNAARARANAIKTEKSLLLRQLISAFETSRAQLLRLDQRHDLYARQLLPQMTEQSEAYLNAYNNDTGDFAGAVRARIAELNAKIEMLAISVGRQKQIAQLNYLLTDAAQGETRHPDIPGADHE